MSLRQQAELDLALTVEDPTGFGWAITVTDPAGTAKELVGLSTDIANAIDPETGQIVAGRTASVAVRIASLTAAGFGIPKGVASKASKPWRVTFADINGAAHEFKVIEPRPDRAIGLVVLILEAYKA